MDILTGLLVLLVVLLGVGYAYVQYYLPNKPLSAGDIVQLKFVGNPAVIIKAAFGVNGGESHYDASLSSQSIMFCDVPNANIARNSDGSGTISTPYGSQTTWITDGGVNWHDNHSMCISQTSTFDGKLQSCSTAFDCMNLMECNPNNTFDGCLCTDGSCKNVLPSFLDCPCGSPCIANPLHNSALPPTGINIPFFCSLSTYPKFACESGYCKLQSSTATTCPPPPSCSLYGVVNPQGQPTCPAATTPLQPTDPCTGCYAGQTCQVYDQSTLQGSCTGLAQSFIPLSVDFVIEGIVTSADDVNAVIQWDRIQCAYPYYNKVWGPQYHLGCIAWRDFADAQMSSIVFDGLDPGYYSKMGLKFADLWPVSTVVNAISRALPANNNPANASLTVVAVPTRKIGSPVYQTGIVEMIMGPTV